MIFIFIVNKWPHVNSHAIAYLSRIRGRQVYVITLRCNLCDDIHPTPSSPTLSISLRFLLRILFLSKARHACGLSDLEISDITLGSSPICDKFPRPSHRLLLQKVNHQRSVIFSRSAACPVHFVCTSSNDELLFLQVSKAMVTIQTKGCWIEIARF